MKNLARSAAMIVLAGAVLLPFLWTLSTSLKPLSEVNRVPPEWVSPNMNLSSYSEMFFYLPFATYTVNSLVVATSATAITLVLGSLAGFAFSRFSFPGKSWFLLLFLLSQMLPGASVIIPLFQLMREAGLYGSTIGLILVHSALLLPFTIWLLYGFFNSIPREVEDAALIDGCSRLTALRRVLLPLALPGIGATALFAFLGSWNEFFFALILTNSDATHTIPVGIGLFVGEFNDVWNQMSAAAVLFSIPPIIVYLLMRRTFIKGLAAGAVK
jgi:ABC-type glycerol-3-phosphate transport system permease component